MSKKEWFSDWFDSKYYHILYQHRDYTEAEQFINNLTKYLSPNLESKVLDLACGKGRHSIFLNKLGYDVTGVDLSPQSIDHANQFSNDRLHFFTHDMRDKEPHGPYNYVFNLFTSFGYFDNNEDDLKVLNSVSEVLSEDGILVLDFLNPEKVIANLVPSEEKELDGVVFKISRAVEKGFIVKNILFEVQGKSHAYQERVKVLTTHDFQDLFSKTDLKIQKIFGSYELSDFDEAFSDRQIIIAKK